MASTPTIPNVVANERSSETSRRGLQVLTLATRKLSKLASGQAVMDESGTRLRLSDDGTFMKVSY